VSTGEEAEGVKTFLLEVMKLRRNPFETLNWRVDGHSGLRRGIISAVEKASKLFNVQPAKAVVSMDQFHMYQSVTKQISQSLCKTDGERALRDIRLLSEVSVTFHERAKRAMMSVWNSRDGWAKFRDYFYATYFTTLPGWWGDYLGQGTPRTTGGLEGRWPSVHRLMKGKKYQKKKGDHCLCRDFMSLFSIEFTSGVSPSHRRL
jgi:hypothetical protein